MENEDHSNNTTNVIDVITISNEQNNENVIVSNIKETNDSNNNLDDLSNKRKSDQITPKKVKKIKSDGSKYFIDEAEEGEDDEEIDKSKNNNKININKDDDEDDEEEDDDDENNYKYDEFVVKDTEDIEDSVADRSDDGLNSDNDSDNEVEKSAEKRQFSRLKKRKEDFTLDEEDYKLIEENQLDLSRKLIDDDEDVIVPEKITKPKRLNIPGGEDDNLSDYEKLPDDTFEEFDDDNDIENEDDGNDQRDNKPKKIRQQLNDYSDYNQLDGPSFEQIQDARDIFGDAFDFDEFDEVDDENENELYDEEERPIKLTLKQREDKIFNSLRLKFDRNQLVNNFCTSKDDEIRTIDRPERYQNVLVGRNIPDDNERSLEAEWISQLLVSKIRESNDNTNNDLQPNDFKSSIENILKFIQVDNYEIPFIATYRKDHFKQEINRNHLWYIFSLDEKWEKIFALKYRLYSLIDDISLSAKAELNFDSLENEKNDILNEKRQLIDQIQRLNNEINSFRQLEENALEVIDNNQFESDEVKELDRERLLKLQESIAITQIEITNYKSKLSDNSTKMNEINEKINNKKYLYKYNKVTAIQIISLFPYDRYVNLSKSCYNEYELRTILKYLDIIIKGCLCADKQNNSKTSISKDKYSKYLSLIPNLHEFIHLFCINSSDFGDALRHGFKCEPPVTPLLDVSLMIESFILDNHINIDEKSFLYALEVVVCTELANEPTIRKESMEVYKQFSYLSTRPTAKGKSTINPFSELFGLHYINNKPINDLLLYDKSLYIKLYEAQSQGLITITITTLPKIPSMNDLSISENPSSYDIYINQLKLLQLYQPSTLQSDELDQHIRINWDKLREKLIIAMLKKYLIPQLEMDLHRELLRVGRETIIEEASENFAHLISYGPFRPLRLVSEEDKLEARRLNYKNPPLHHEDIKDLLLSTPRLPFYGSVMGIYISNGGNKSPICFGFVDKNGLLRGYDLLPNRVINQKKDKIKQFLLDYKPQVIVINAGGGLFSKSLAMLIEKEIIPEVIKEIEIKKKLSFREKQLALMNIDSNHMNNDDDDLQDDGEYKAHVLILKDDVSQIFEHSPRAKKMFPDLQPGIAAAVCLARYTQEPLAEFCNMWWSADATETFGYELLFLDIHPNKSLLRGIRQPLLKALERKLVDAVNDIGVDINQMVSYDHMSGMLAFISGFGLRKADALRNAIRSTLKFVGNRKDLLTNKLVGSVVYNNSIGFLRIRDENFESDDSIYNVNSNEDDNMIDEDDDYTDNEYHHENSHKRLLNPLDNTRIHPECYVTHDFTIKICADALEVDITKLKPEKIIKKLIQNVRKDLIKRCGKYMKWLNLWKYLQRPSFNSTYTEEFHKNNEIIAKNLSTELNDSLFLLELDEYADDLMKLNKGRRRLQLEDIKEELRYPFLDLRYPLQSIEPNDFFTIITNETDYSLHIGLKVGVIVQSYIDDYINNSHVQKAIVRIDNGLRGVISIYELFDEKINTYDVNIKEKLIIGQSYQAVIINIKKDRLSLELSMKPSLLEKKEEYWYKTKYDSSSYSKYSSWWMNSIIYNKKLDKYFIEDEALSIYTEYETNMNKLTSSLLSNSNNSNQNKNPNTDNMKVHGRLLRNIYHPLFANIDYKEAEARLEKDNKGDGDVVIRPSSKGPNRLTITWAFQKKFYKHIDIVEKDSRTNNKINVNSIGNELYIQEPDLPDPYSDLDEIYSGYIEPMNDYILAITKLNESKHFHRGSPEEVENTMRNQILSEEKRGIPREKQRIPWFLRFEPNKPGYFAITWMSLNINTTKPVKTELFVIRPYGYKIKDKVFKTLDSLINFFKVSVMSAKSQNPVVQQPPVPPNAPLPSGRKSRFDRPSIQPTDYNPSQNQYAPPVQYYQPSQDYSSYVQPIPNYNTYS